MKRLMRIATFTLVVLLVLTLGASAATAAPNEKPLDGWSSITIWAFVDYDGDGFITPGDGYLHEVSACLSHKQEHTTFCGATDFGDVWWEPLTGGTFVTWMDAKDSDIPPGHKLNSITCSSTVEDPSGKACTTRLHKWEAQFKQVPGEFTNVYYGFVPEE